MSRLVRRGYLGMGFHGLVVRMVHRMVHNNRGHLLRMLSLTIDIESVYSCERPQSNASQVHNIRGNADFYTILGLTI